MDLSVRPLWSLVARMLRAQKGALLPMAIIASILGLTVVTPVAVLVASASRGQAHIADSTRNYYAADAAIHAVAADLIRGADLTPLSPDTYVFPTVSRNP